MKLRFVVLVSGVAALIVGFSLVTARAQQGSGAQGTRAPRNVAEFDKMLKDISNWGRWGKDDVRGTLNLVTDAKRRQAAALVKTGTAVSLAHNAVTEKAPDNPTPFEVTNGGDTYRVSFHGTTHSHMDAICSHVWEGHLFNGNTESEVRAKEGCTKLGIETWKNGVTTRGILLDIPRLKGVPWLEPGTPVYSEDIEAWEKKAGVRVSSGDAIFLRTGRWARRAKLGPWELYPGGAPGTGEPGYHASAVAWMKTRDVAFVGADLSNDVFPSRVEGKVTPVHGLVLMGLGAPIFDAMDLELLAETAARLNRWEFMLTGAPIAVAGGTGSPINLTALF